MRELYEKVWHFYRQKLIHGSDSLENAKLELDFF